MRDQYFAIKRSNIKGTVNLDGSYNLCLDNVPKCRVLYECNGEYTVEFNRFHIQNIKVNNPVYAIVKNGKILE